MCMKQFLLKAFSDGGDVSMMRLMSFLCVISAVVISLVGIYRGSDLSGVAILVGSFLVPAFGGKSAQAYIEKGAKNE
jgi:hypothetical protein